MNINCVICGQSFNRGRTRRLYCSTKCGSKAERERAKKPQPCTWCGKIALREFRPDRPTIACSGSCRNYIVQFNMGNVYCPWSVPEPKVKCPPSQKEGPVLPAKIRFVSGICQSCGLHFIADKVTGSNNEKYCSTTCGRRVSQDKRRALKKSAFIARVSRAKIYERDGWHCHLCGDPLEMDKKVPHPLAPTIDHVIPLARGGTHEPANVAAAHFLCNSIKGDRVAA